VQTLQPSTPQKQRPSENTRPINWPVRNAIRHLKIDQAVTKRSGRNGVETGIAQKERQQTRRKKILRSRKDDQHGPDKEPSTWCTTIAFGGEKKKHESKSGEIRTSSEKKPRRAGRTPGKEPTKRERGKALSHLVAWVKRIKRRDFRKNARRKGRKKKFFFSRPAGRKRGHRGTDKNIRPNHHVKRTPEVTRERKGLYAGGSKLVIKLTANMKRGKPERLKGTQGRAPRVDLTPTKKQPY